MRCGTSRIVVLDGYDLPESPAREAEIARLMMGESRADGLGGAHDQLNQAAVVWPAGEHTFRFRFYQVERADRRLVSDLACAQAASGAAVFALLRGHVQLDGDGALEALDEATGKRILLRPQDPGAFWDGPWDVRFAATELTTSVRLLLRGAAMRPTAEAGG